MSSTTSLPTDSDVALVRQYIGSSEPPSDDELFDLLLEADGPYAVAQSILQTRLGELLAAPASFSVDGYSESNSANIAALQKQLATLGGITGVGVAGVTVGSVDLERCDRRGR